MSVTTPKGFRASGVAAGLKPSGNLDVALVVAVQHHQQEEDGEQAV